MVNPSREPTEQSLSMSLDDLVEASAALAAKLAFAPEQMAVETAATEFVALEMVVKVVKIAVVVEEMAVEVMVVECGVVFVPTAASVYPERVCLEASDRRNLGFVNFGNFLNKATEKIKIKIKILAN